MPLENTTDGDARTPIDRTALIRIRDRVRTGRQGDRVYVTLKHGETCLFVEYNLDYYPAAVETVYLNVRWYTNDDFTIHYHETWPSSDWDCRWDRHPNTHNTTDHFHPPPNAPTPGEDATYPDTLHEVMRIVEWEMNDRIARSGRINLELAFPLGTTPVVESISSFSVVAVVMYHVTITVSMVSMFTAMTVRS